MKLFNFKKKAEDEVNSTYKAIYELRAFRKIGEKFNYLGVEMIVISHCNYGFNGIFPRLQADYVTKTGEIKSIAFDYSELETLKNENK